MKFDDIVRILGDFGPYQKKIYFIFCIPVITSSLITYISNFILGIPKHRCRLPEEFNDTDYYPVNFTIKDLVNFTIPIVNGEFSQCYRYDIHLTNSSNDFIRYGNVSQVKCNEWVYDDTIFTSTVVSDFNLVCDRQIYRSHSNMVLMAGFMASSLITGIFSDMFGRRVGLFISMICAVISTFGTAFAPNFTAFIILRFILGFGNIGVYIASFILGLELVGVSKRTFAGMAINLVFSIGLFSLALLAYFIRDWSTLQLVVSAIILLCYLSVICFVPESTRWLVSRGKTQKAEVILQEAARVNKIELPDDLFGKDFIEEDNQQIKFWKMFSSPTLIIRSVIIFYNWIVTVMVYFGLSLNVGNITGDIYLNYTISVAVEFLAYILCIYLLDVWGRKILLCSSMLLGGVACICTLFPVLYGDPSHAWITITLSMVGKFGISAGFAVVYVYSCELFPTVTRNFGIGVSSFLSRIGGIASPYIADLGLLVEGDVGKAIPLIIFGCASVAAGLLSLLLPETKNRKLPETIEDAKNFGKNNVSDMQLAE